MRRATAADANVEDASREDVGATPAYTERATNGTPCGPSRSLLAGLPGVEDRRVRGVRVAERLAVDGGVVVGADFGARAGTLMRDGAGAGLWASLRVGVRRTGCRRRAMALGPVPDPMRDRPAACAAMGSPRGSTVRVTRFRDRASRNAMRSRSRHGSRPSEREARVGSNHCGTRTGESAEADRRTDMGRPSE